MVEYLWRKKRSQIYMDKDSTIDKRSKRKKREKNSCLMFDVSIFENLQLCSKRIIYSVVGLTYISRNVNHDWILSYKDVSTRLNSTLQPCDGTMKNGKQK